MFPCHQFVGQPEWQMGNVLTGEYDLEQKARFARSNVYNKEKCRGCWAKFYCSGGCNANNQQYEGDILKAHTLSCELEKKRLECAIMIQTALNQAQKNLTGVAFCTGSLFVVHTELLLQDTVNELKGGNEQ